jgi:tRNA(fMet)-specific endonuclease VapC
MACLDTSLLLDVYGKNGRRVAARAGALLAALESREEPVVTTRLTVAELYVGLERSNDREAEVRRIESILDEFEVLEFDDAAARHFGRITAQLQRTGRPAGDMDVLIAATCLANGQTLATGNPKHFADIPGLVVESY